MSPAADRPPNDTVRVAAAQFYSGPDVPANLELCIAFVRQAAAAGARLIVLPENANRVRDFTTRETCFDTVEALDGKFMQGLQAAAAALGIMVVAGIDLKGDQPPVAHIGVVLIGADGSLLHVHHKTVLWDYEYTLFTPGSKELAVIDTPIGRLGLLSCADGIVPEVPRILALKGAEILCNALNSRGPDEMRVHEPLRAIESHVWHIAANTVGGPETGYPWPGGSQIISPTGDILANAGETEPGVIWADITPHSAHPKRLHAIGDLAAFRRPDLYGELTADIHEHAVAKWYGPVPADAPRIPLKVATLQLSWYHATSWTVSRALGQIAYAAKRGAQLGVFPELFCWQPGAAERDPAAAAALSAEVLDKICAVCAEHGLWVVVNLVERDAQSYFSTAYLIDANGTIAGRYRKIHLSEAERRWATPGDRFVVLATSIGAIGLMIGDEVWLPEMARILSLRGAELIAHPTSWDRLEAATMAAVERTEENRTHLVSCARTDNPAGFGSQIVLADRFIPGQPIALMRYPTAIWSRTGFEENIILEIDLQDAHSKVQGFHLDPLRTRQPALYAALVDPGCNSALSSIM